MQNSELRLLAEGLISSASEVLRQIQSLADRFALESTAVPAELCHLREAVSATRELLETLNKAEAVALRTVKQERASQGFHSELLLAEGLFKRLNENLQTIYGSQDVGQNESRQKQDGSPIVKVVPSTTLKSRWSFHREQIGKRHKELRDNCSRCLGEMLLMNTSISADVEPRMEHSTRFDSPWSESLPHQNLDNEDKVLRQQRLQFMQDSSYVDDPKILLHHEHLKMLRPDVEPKVPPRISRARSTSSTSTQPTLHRRVFDHAELMRSGIAASVASSTSSSIIERTPQYTPSRLGEIRGREVEGQGSCTCRCHTEGNSPSIWAISAFKYAVGVMSLEYRGQSNAFCNECPSTCVTRRKGRSMRLVYSFPAWLFHAAISASFTDTLGSPELVLRVLRRIPTDQKSIFTSIFGIIARGDGDGLRRALRAKEVSVLDVNGINGTGVLWTCVAMNRYDLLEILLFEGADLFQLDDKGIAPYSFLLHTLYTSPRCDSATRTRLETTLPMEQMLEACQLNELHKIVVGLRHTSVREYMQDSSRVHEANSYDIRFRTPLGFASARGDLSAVKELLEAGALPDLEVPTRAKPKGPLASACSNGHLAIVEELVAAGADVNARNSHQTPLHHLAWSNSHHSPAIAACLIQHGADIHAEDNFHTTPLDLAAHHNNAALAECLLRNGADPNHRDWEGSNALQIAISSNACAAATILLEHNVDYRNTDTHKHGILHYLAMCGTVAMMEIMARHRMTDLDVDAPDKQGLTPMQLCRARSDATEALQQAFELLLDHVNQDSRQQTATIQ